MKDTEENRLHVKQQLARLAQKDFAPRHGDDWKPFIEALLTMSESHAHCTAIVTEIESEEGKFPEIATFRRIAGVLRSMRFQRDPECSRCDASGFVVVEKTYMFLGREETTTATKRCDCWAMRPYVKQPWQWDEEFV